MPALQSTVAEQLFILALRRNPIPGSQTPIHSSAQKKVTEQNQNAAHRASASVQMKISNRTHLSALLYNVPRPVARRIMTWRSFLTWKSGGNHDP